MESIASMLIPRPTGKVSVEWIDAGRAAQCPADPAFPEGVTIDLRGGQISPHCVAKFKYPAVHCGRWVISCTCGYSAIVTAAGRADDPRVALIPCKRKGARGDA